MASLSDQIDRLTQSTRAIKATVASTHNNSTGIFTRAVLNTHLGDLIREVDPTELGLFSLVNNHYEQEEHQLHRTQFSGATPLRNQNKHDIDPEIYAHAALKCIRQYQPIRPMPRAYDQIVAILNRFKVVRGNLNNLNASLQQTTVNDDISLAKSRIEQEERRIKELQHRMEELAKRKEIALKFQRKTPDQELPEVPSVALPSSPQEEKFWTPIGPSRTLRFTDNLMDEFVDLADISTASFQSPVPTSKLEQLGSLGVTALFDAPFVPDITPEKDNDRENDDDNEQEYERKDLKSTPEVESLATPTMTPHVDNIDMKKPDDQTTETPCSRQRKIRVNIEVERIMAKIWSTMGDIVMPSAKSKSGSLPTNEIIAHLQQLAMRSPRPESPVASSVSSTSIEGSSPTFQQVLTAHLLMTLLSAPPHYSMSLNKVKDKLAAKAKECGASGVGQGMTRVLYGCVAKRLVKIDRGGGEQIVKFDI